MQVVNAEGVLRVWRDVMAHRTGAGDYVVLSDEAGIKGERLSVYFASPESRPIPVRVVDSRPVIRDGAMLHELRLSPLTGESVDSDDTTGDTALEAE